jgi:hypothetical protein
MNFEGLIVTYYFRKISKIPKSQDLDKSHLSFDAWFFRNREIYDSQKLSGTYPKAPLTGYRLTAPPRA